MTATIQEASHGEFARGLRVAAPVLIGLVPAAMVLGAQATAKGIAPPAVDEPVGLGRVGPAEHRAHVVNNAGVVRAVPLPK